MPTTDTVLLDTHTVLWWKAEGGSRLSSATRRRIAEAAQILISPLSCWEVGMLLAKGRIALDRPLAAWVADLRAEQRIEMPPVAASAAVLAAQLPEFHGDPADRFLVATAIETRACLLTKDRQIRDYARRHGSFRAAW